jgi:hypothetical protein
VRFDLGLSKIRGRRALSGGTLPPRDGGEKRDDAVDALVCSVLYLVVRGLARGNTYLGDSCA